MSQQQDPGEQGMVSQIGPLIVDWPRAGGYYGAITAAVIYGVIEWPVGLFIAAVPFFRLLERPTASFPERTLGQILDGAALPVGGDSPSAIRTDGTSSRSGVHLPNPVGGVFRMVRAETESIWREAQALR
ncbi:MAG TPA: hypothetical protein VKX16_17600 [Chloroflexota bacterium]|nr:hypothetical protein [Chloroflexota bacterium]